MGLTTNEQGVLDKKWKIQALKTVQASLKEQLNLRESNPKINKRLKELHRMQTLSTPKETQIFARFRTVGCVGSVLGSLLMALALAFFVLRDVVRVESSGELGEIPVPAGQDDDFEAQSTEGRTRPNKEGLAVPAVVEDYNGRDILNAKTDEPAENGEDDPAEDGDVTSASDNDQKGGFDEVYQEVIKPLDADALPEGAGLLPPQETATGVSEADETLVAEESKAKEETASKKTGKAGKSVTEERAKLQQTIMKAHPQTLSIAKKDPSPNGLVANEPADFAAQSEKSPKDWPKKSSVLHRGFVMTNTNGLAYSHMSTVTRLPPTAAYRYMVAWQTGKKVEGVEGQHLRAAFSDDAKTWTEPRTIPVGDKAVWSPVLFTHQGYVYLYYSVSTTCLRAKTPKHPERWAPGGDILVVKSLDGITWGPPVSIYKQKDDESGIPKVIANQPEVTANGKQMVLPYWKERPSQSTCATTGHATAGVLVADTGGSEWKAYGEITSRGTWLIEGTVARRPDGKLLQLFRTKKGAIFQSVSPDGGRSWGTVTSLGLPNPNSKIDALRLSTGELVLCYNDSPNQRNRMRVAISADGDKWHLLADLEVPGKTGFAYAYPTMAQDGDKLLVTYSVWRKARNIPIDQSGVRVVLIQLPQPIVGIDKIVKSAPKLGLVTVQAGAAINFKDDDKNVGRAKARAVRRVAGRAAAAKATAKTKPPPPATKKG